MKKNNMDCEVEAIEAIERDGVPYTPITEKDRLQSYYTAKDNERRALDSATPFIDSSLNDYYELTNGLTLMCAKSGCGKSTTASNLVARFIQDNPSKQVLYISNEETSSTILDRIACTILALPYNQIRLLQGHSLEQEVVEGKVREIAKNIEIVEQSHLDMTVMEDVQKAILYASSDSAGRYGLVVVDYLQTIYQSRENPGLKEFEVSKRMGHFLKDHCRHAHIPIIIFAQLKPKHESPDFSARICGDKTFFHHASAAIEIVPDFTSGFTKLIFHKLRFGARHGQSAFLFFTDGRLIGVPEPFLASLQEKKTG